MAVISGWWPSVNGDRKYYIEQQAAVNAQIYSNGVLPVGHQFQVLATEGLGIKVTPGYAWLNGYWILNDADYAMTLNAPDGVMHRVDSVMLQWNRANRETSITIVKGVYGSAPAATSPRRDADVYELCLAQIYVEAGATHITQADVTDTRPDAELCGLSAVYDPPESDAWFAQFNAGYQEWLQRSTTEYNDWLVAQQTDFANWYQSAKDLLDAEVAMQLNARIDNVNNAVEAVQNDVNALIKTPTPTGADNGKYYGIVNGKWEVTGLPVGIHREIYRGAYTIAASAWVDGSATISNSKIRTDTDVDFIISNAQKGTFALVLMDPEANGHVTATISAAPDEDIIGTLVVTEVLEG